MAGQQQRGRPSGGRTSGPITAERAGKIALVAAGVVFVGGVVFSIFSIAIQGGRVELGDLLVNELDGVPHDAALFGAVLWAAVTRGSEDALVKGSAVVYVGSLVTSLLVVALNGLGSGLGTLLGPVSTVIFFVGFVMAIRLYHGKTVLPGVGFRL